MKKVRIVKNGPYEVAGDVPLKNAIIEVDDAGISTRWKEGREYPAKEGNYYLCRCGHSANKPYCDGAHVKAGFEGAERAGHAPYMDGAELFRGETVDLLDNESLCASMRFCDRAPRAWSAAVHSGNAENRRIAIEEAGDCAAGRLVAVEKDGTPIEPELPQEIDAIQDTAAGRRGPLWIKGGIPIEGADGREYEVRNRVTLCRCGASRNMPYCDISHMQCAHMEGFDE